MALIEPLRAARVLHLDTAPIIYLVEQNPSYFELVLPVAQAIAAGEIRAVSSYVTLLEVLVKPLEQGALEVAERYRAALLGQRNLEMVELDAEIAEEAARIRARYAFKIADSIQLATARLHRADTFLTNDVDLGRFSELRVVVLEHHAVH